MRVTSFHQPAAGFGSFSFSTSDIAGAVVKAVMPAMKAEMPGLINSAMPTLSAQMPNLVGAAMPAVKAQLPALVPVIAGQVPALMDAAIPAVYAKMPQLTAKLTPLLRKELEGALDEYAQTYLGPAARFKEWAPALALAGSFISLFASGIIIYQFWQGER